ncbi:hypothetical protein CEG14_18770 [Bordetella genomosp. 1]|uniref:Uncharacterized protein n=1 Tax=Bordetella genomosp. 1 TaxID=1395607 RepID=A0A261S7H0_9BORD|nr:tetratricopeptide repeat protein [Bordetella genomosp. 1]OZI32922.1 hypothetical protein CEG14_18770 [Bordetella genomosp. 1]
MVRTSIDHRAGRLLAAAAAVAVLAGCQASRVETAQQLMREQQREQALAQDKADRDMRKNAATPPEMALSMIREAQRDGRYFASLAYIDAYRQSYGESTELAALRADALRMTGQPQAAEQVYRALLNGDQAARGWHGLGLLAGAQGDFPAAADRIARAAQLRPTDAQYLGDLGYALLRAGDPAAARVPMGQAAELDPTNVRIIGNLALLLLVTGDEASARHVMDQAQLPEPARQRVSELASEIRERQRTQQSARPAQTLAAVSIAPQDAATTSRPAVRQVGEDGRRPAAAPAATAPATPMPLPVLQRPLLDRMGNTPVQP